MIRTLRIQLTEQCDLNCFYCCHEGTANKFSIIKNRNLISFIRACYDVLGIRRVKFTGGEPLEYDENILDIINAFTEDKSRRDISFSIVTNATHYSRLKSLADNAPEMEVTISLPVPPSVEYKNLYHKLTGSVRVDEDFNNVIESVNYLKQQNRSFKINYVLCKNYNVSDKLISEVIYFSENSCVQLRFLELAINATTNNKKRVMSAAFGQYDFERIIGRIDPKSVLPENKKDSRAFCTYEVNDTIVKYIKFFCSDSCNSCPEGKTSLWLTSTGTIKQCSYRSSAVPVANWQVTEIKKLLERKFYSKS